MGRKVLTININFARSLAPTWTYKFTKPVIFQIETVLDSPQYNQVTLRLSLQTRLAVGSRAWPTSAFLQNPSHTWECSLKAANLGQILLLTFGRNRPKEIKLFAEGLPATVQCSKDWDSGLLPQALPRAISPSENVKAPYWLALIVLYIKKTINIKGFLCCVTQGCLNSNLFTLQCWKTISLALWSKFSVSAPCSLARGRSLYT